MNKNVFKILFVLVATLVNVVIAIALFALLLALANLVISPETNQNIRMVVQLLIVGGALFGSMAVYNLVFKKVGQKLFTKFGITPDKKD